MILLSIKVKILYRSLFHLKWFVFHVLYDKTAFVQLMNTIGICAIKLQCVRITNITIYFHELQYLHSVTFSLESLTVCFGYKIEGVHVSIHAHGYAFLFRTVQWGAWLAYALFEAFFRHFRKQFLSIGHGYLLFHLLHQLVPLRTAQISRP